MVGSEAPRPGSRSRNDVRDEWLRASDDVAGPDECELCRSATSTSVQYDMRVCDACEREYLP